MHVFTIQLSLMSFNWKGKREKLFITAPLRIEYPQLTTEYSYSLPLFFMYWIISSTTTHTKRTNNNKEVKKYQPMQDTTFDVFLGITEKARMVILLVFFLSSLQLFVFSFKWISVSVWLLYRKWLFFPQFYLQNLCVVVEFVVFNLQCLYLWDRWKACKLVKWFLNNLLCY